MGISKGPDGRGAGRRGERGLAAALPAEAAGLPVARTAARAGLSLALAALFVWLLADRWAQIDRAALAAALARLHPAQWALALGFTAVSFWAAGRYDAVLHRHLATGVPVQVARRAGIAAIAVSQTLGLGLISGAIIRWRLLPGVSLWLAARLTAAVAMSFLAGWAVVTSAVLVALPAAPFRGWAALVLIAASGLAALSLAAPRLPGLSFRWPNGFTLTRLVALCAVDTLAAALAFQALLPSGAAAGLGALLPAFLLALGAGLALGTPGGMGAFEITLISLMPAAPEAEFLAAILAWRLVYHALPALLGAGLAILGPSGRAPRPARPAPWPRERPAETGLCHQGQHGLTLVAGQPWLVGRQGHTLIGLLDPVGGTSPARRDAALRDLRQMAEAEGRLPVAYKISPRLAVQARAQGLALRRIGWEAWVAPADYRLAASSRSGLRRKLRRAEAAGVTVRPCPAELAPWEALDRIAAHWATAHGGERGFSMGRHDRAYLAHQRLYIAWAGGRPIAYASFHTAPGEWALDLMRHDAGLPDGTMHSLIQAAIDEAAGAGVPRLSLAAVPDGAFGRQDLTGRLIAALAPETAATGLYRFKAAFAPRWTPRYLAAPGCAGLMLAGLSLWRAITRPPPLPSRPIMPQIERDDAEYGFASAPGPWHIARDSG